VPRRSKYPLSTGHTYNEPYIQISETVRTTVTISVRSRTAHRLVWSTSDNIWLKGSFNDKLDRRKKRKMRKTACKRHCRMPCDIILFFSRLPRKTDRKLNKLLHIDLATKYIHYMQLKIGYCYISKKSWRWRNWNDSVCHKLGVVNLPLASNYNDISEYKKMWNTLWFLWYPSHWDISN
jgi:hypothetical protein